MRDYLTFAKPKIPINFYKKDQHLEFKTNEMNYSLDITFEIKHEKEINIGDIILKNLFLTLKSYFSNKDIIINHVFMIFTNHEIEETYEKKKLLNQLVEIKIHNIKKWNFYDFEEWFINQYEKDWKYIRFQKCYGLRILFFKNDIYWKNKKIYPIYPWDKEFESIFYLKTTMKEQTILKKEEFLTKKENKLSKKEARLNKLEKEIKKKIKEIKNLIKITPK